MGGERRGGGITYGMSAGEGGGARTPEIIRRVGDRALASSGESSGDTRGGAAVSSFMRQASVSLLSEQPTPKMVQMVRRS